MSVPSTQIAPVTASLRIEADAWLSQMMERAVFRVDLGDAGAPTAEDRERLGAHVAANRPAMYFAKVGTDAIAAVRELSHVGMHVVDTSIALELDTTAAVTPPPATGVIVEDFRPNDADAVLDIAGSCFRYSRFHVDPDVPRDVANRIKREWVGSYIRGRRGDRLLVASVGGRPVGFLAVMSVREKDGCVRIIDLIGVGTDAQRRGVGSGLVAAFVDGAGPGEVRRVVTQASNIPSLRLYERWGFRMTRSGYVLHMHA